MEVCAVRDAPAATVSAASRKGVSKAIARSLLRFAAAARPPSRARAQGHRGRGRHRSAGAPARVSSGRRDKFTCWVGGRPSRRGEPRGGPVHPPQLPPRAPKKRPPGPLRGPRPPRRRSAPSQQRRRTGQSLYAQKRIRHRCSPPGRIGAAPDSSCGSMPVHILHSRASMTLLNLLCVSPCMSVYDPQPAPSNALGRRRPSPSRGELPLAPARALLATHSQHHRARIRALGGTSRRETEGNA